MIRKFLANEVLKSTKDRISEEVCKKNINRKTQKSKNSFKYELQCIQLEPIKKIVFGSKIPVMAPNY